MRKIELIAICLAFTIGGISSTPPLQFDLSDTEEFSKSTFSQSIFYQLPREVTPKHYDITIRPILEEGTGHGEIFTAPGHVDIFVDVLTDQAFNNITLHIFNMQINEASVQVTEVGNENSIEVVGHSYESDKDFYIIQLGEGLTVGAEYKISIDYTAKIPMPEETMGGMYLSYYLDSNGTRRYLMSTQFEPTDARRAFPCFDEPDLKATWTLQILRQTHYKSLANMPLENTTQAEPGWELDIYPESVVMSSYLVCFTVNDYTMEEADDGHYRSYVRIWGPPPIMAEDGGKYAPNLSARVLHQLEEELLTEYVVPKMDKIALPQFSAGAMENFGLNTYLEVRLMWIDGVSTWQDKVQMTSTISHEIAHQWFGNLVTMMWWDDIWLNEGFATYYAARAGGAAFPHYLLGESFVFSGVQAAMQFDVSPNTHPLHNDVTPSEIMINFDTISYQKGGSILRMMNAALTDPIFTDILIRYLENFHSSNARQEDLFATFDEVLAEKQITLPHDLTVDDVLSTWTHQTGFPVVTATRDFETGEITLTQEKFVPEYPSEDPIPEDKWHVPILYKDGSNDISNNNQWLSANQDNLTLSGFNEDTDWVIVNPMQKGYYRVSYDDENFQLISDQLQTQHEAFDPETRSGLIDDIYNLGFSGYKHLDNAFGLSKYMQNERSLLPWATFLNNMALPRRMILQSSTFILFRRYLLNLIKAPLLEIGFDVKDEDYENVGNSILLRTRLVEWACNLGDTECINFAKTKLNDWMNSPDRPSVVFPDLQPIVYCHGMANGGDAEWNFILHQYRTFYRNLLPNTMRLNLVRALACSKQSFRLESLLEMSINIDSGIRAEHRTAIFQAVASNSAGINIAFDFIRNNFQLIKSRFGVGLIGSTISTMSTFINDSSFLKDIESLIAANEADLDPIKTSLQTSITNINRNLRWMNRNHDAMKSALIQFTTPN